jgi:hypothetical protein
MCYLQAEAGKQQNYRRVLCAAGQEEAAEQQLASSSKHNFDALQQFQVIHLFF